MHTFQEWNLESGRWEIFGERQKTTLNGRSSHITGGQLLRA